MEKLLTFGAECGGGEFALKNNFGINRKPNGASGLLELADGAGKIPLRLSNPPQASRIRVTVNVAVATVDGSPIVEIGNDHDIGLVISRAGFHPRLQLARVVGGAQVRVANTASNLKTTELVYQKDVDHTGHRVAAINSRGAILQDVDVIDHREGNEIDVHPGDAGRGTCGNPAAATNYGNAFSIDENQSFFGQQTAQIGYDAAIPPPTPLAFWLMVEPISCGSLVSRSVALRTPNFSMSAGR